MDLTIVLRKTVADIPTAETLTQVVKDKLADHPEIAITASVGQQITVPET